jgi:hypothetical protein
MGSSSGRDANLPRRVSCRSRWRSWIGPLCTPSVHRLPQRAVRGHLSRANAVRGSGLVTSGDISCLCGRASRGACLCPASALYCVATPEARVLVALLGVSLLWGAAAVCRGGLAVRWCLPHPSWMLCRDRPEIWEHARCALRTLDTASTWHRQTPCSRAPVGPCGRRKRHDG